MYVCMSADTHHTDVPNKLPANRSNRRRAGHPCRLADGKE